MDITDIIEIYEKLVQAIKLLEEAISCVAGLEDELDVIERAKKDL
jgi:hypothetical protein